jgi:L-asparaginase
MLILATGGTFDKDYAIDGNLVFNHSVLPKVIQEARLTCEHQLQVLMQKDSLEMSVSDRMAILEACRTTNASQIVIIHGTDTMTETAEFLQRAALDKTIVLTGAMRPFAFGNSDASFNVGFALAVAQTANIGVYIAMQGECFTAGKVTKDKQRMQFVHDSS